MFGYYGDYGDTTVPPKPSYRGVTPKSTTAAQANILGIQSPFSTSLATQFSQAVTPPPGYVAPAPVNPYPTTPESHTVLYVGLALGAIVVVGGIVLLVEER